MKKIMLLLFILLVHFVIELSKDGKRQTEELIKLKEIQENEQFRRDIKELYEQYKFDKETRFYSNIKKELII